MDQDEKLMTKYQKQALSVMIDYMVCDSEVKCAAFGMIIDRIINKWKLYKKM